MRSVDTNVLARWLLGDDAAQSGIAADILTEPVWISQTVLLELGWVLFKALGLPRPIVATMLEQAVNLETAQVENDRALEWAISRFRAGADWADVIHLATCPEEIGTFTTFDKSLARKAGRNAPVRIETVDA